MAAFSKEQLNFFKFSTLVLDEFPKVLRQIFVTMWNSKFFTSHPWNDSTTVRNMLLTSEGGKTGIPTGKSIEEWDCTALFKATIYAKTFGDPSIKGSTLNDLYVKKVKPAPGSFHLSVQSSTANQDETYALAIDQLRLLRNKLCHLPKPEIVKTDFDVYVQLATNALTAVNVDTSFADDIGQMNEDDFPTEKVKKLEECRMKELQAINIHLEYIAEQKLSSIDQRTENMDQKLSAIDERTEQMMENLDEKEKLTDTKPAISSLPVGDQMGNEVVLKNNPSKQVTTEDIGLIAKDITTIWEPLGRALGLEDSALDIINANNPNNAYNRCYKMLLKWTQIKVSRANYGALAKGFKHPTVDRHDLCAKYC